MTLTDLREPPVLELVETNKEFVGCIPKQSRTFFTYKQLLLILTYVSVHWTETKPRIYRIRGFVGTFQSFDHTNSSTEIDSILGKRKDTSM